MGCRLSGTACTSMSPPWATGPDRPPAPPHDHLHRLQLRRRACSCGGSPGATASFSSYPLAPQWVHLQAGACIYKPTLSSLGCRGTAGSTMVLSTVWQGISALMPGEPPPPLSLTWVSAGLFLSTFSSLLSPSCYCRALFTLSEICCHGSTTSIGSA